MPTNKQTYLRPTRILRESRLVHLLDANEALELMMEGLGDAEKNEIRSRIGGNISANRGNINTSLNRGRTELEQQLRESQQAANEGQRHISMRDSDMFKDAVSDMADKHQKELDANAERIAELQRQVSRRRIDDQVEDDADHPLNKDPYGEGYRQESDKDKYPMGKKNRFKHWWGRLMGSTVGRKNLGRDVGFVAGAGGAGLLAANATSILPGVGWASKLASVTNAGWGLVTANAPALLALGLPALYIAGRARVQAIKTNYDIKADYYDGLPADNPARQDRDKFMREYYRLRFDTMKPNIIPSIREGITLGLGIFARPVHEAVNFTGRAFGHAINIFNKKNRDRVLGMFKPVKNAIVETGRLGLWGAGATIVGGGLTAAAGLPIAAPALFVGGVGYGAWRKRRKKQQALTE